MRAGNLRYNKNVLLLCIYFFIYIGHKYISRHKFFQSSIKGLAPSLFGKKKMAILFVLALLILKANICSTDVCISDVKYYELFYQDEQKSPIYCFTLKLFKKWTLLPLDHIASWVSLMQSIVYINCTSTRAFYLLLSKKILDKNLFIYVKITPEVTREFCSKRRA